MTLNRRYFRNIKSSLSFYISTTLLTAISVWLFLCMYSAVDCENLYLKSFNERCNVEDGSFMTAMEFDEETIERDYNVDLEKNNYVNLEKDEYTLRVFAPNESINQYDIVEGNDIKDEHDIMISKSFALANKIEIGSTLELNDVQCKVVGYCIRPDYGAMLENLTDVYFTESDFGIGVASDSLIEELGQPVVYYSVKYNADNEEKFRKEMNDDYLTLFYNTAQCNRRIIYPDSVISQYQMMTQMILPCMLAFVVILIAVILGRKVKNERKQIGTLSALGYRKGELISHYMIFAIIPGVLGSIVGIVATFFSLQDVSEAIFYKLEKYPVDYKFPIVESIIILFLPAIVYALTAIISVRRSLRINVIKLLSGDLKPNRKVSRLAVGNRWKFQTKYKIRMIFGKISRTVTLILGFAVGSVVMLYGFFCMDSCNYYKENQVSKIGSFEYMYFLNDIRVGEPEKGDTMIGKAYESEDGAFSIQLCGGENNNFVDLVNLEGKELEFNNDYYITAVAASLFNVKAGDSFSFYDAITKEKTQITISDIVDNDSQIMIYTSKKNVCKLLDVDENSYNIIMSDEKLDLEEKDILSTVTKNDLKKQMQSTIDGMSSMMFLIKVFGCLICIISVYLMVNMLIQENLSTISMLKVLGYKNGRIGKIVINVYHSLVPIGIVIGFLLGYGVAYLYFILCVTDFQLKIHTYISPISVVLYIVCILVSYFISLFLLQKKVLRVNMVECMKDYRN